jgi:hypothetical protein
MASRTPSPRSSAASPPRPGLTLTAGRRSIIRTANRHRACGHPQQARRSSLSEGARPPGNVIAMLKTLDRGTPRGLLDRAMLLIGFACGLRRSEIVGLDADRDDRRGWIEILDRGLIVTLRGKPAGARPKSAAAPPRSPARSSSCRPDPTSAGFAADRRSGSDRPRQGCRPRSADRSEGRSSLQARVRRRPRPRPISRRANGRKFAGHSLCAGLASSVEVDERYVPKQLGTPAQR